MLNADEECQPLTFQAFRAANVDERVRAIFHELHDWNPLEWAGALCGEAGEAANLCKKLRRGDNVPLDRLREEIGGTLAYLDLLAASLGLSLAECAIYEFNRVSAKFGCPVILPAEEKR